MLFRYLLFVIVDNDLFYDCIVTDVLTFTRPWLPFNCLLLLYYCSLMTLLCELHLLLLGIDHCLLPPFNFILPPLMHSTTLIDVIDIVRHC